MRIATDNHCVACGAGRKKKLLAFTENYVPYCSSYWICNEEHPNHPTQQQTTALYTFKEMQDIIDKRQPEESQFIKQLISKPFSLRLSDYKTITFLMGVKKENNFDSFSDAIKYCIDYTITKTTIHVEETPKVKDEEFTF